MRPQPQWVVRSIFVVLMGTVACRGCGHGPGSNEAAIRFVEKDAHGVLFVPSVGDLGDHWQALVASAREAPGGQLLIKAGADLATQLGFDPMTAEGEKKAGIDPARSLAISGIARSETLMVLPIADLTKLDATVSRLLASMGHEGTRKAINFKGYSVVTYAGADGEKPVFAYTVAQDYMLLAHGADPVGLAIAAAVRTVDLSLQSSKEFVDSRSSLGAHDVYLYDLSPETPLGSRIPPRTMVGFALGARMAGLRIHAPLALDAQKRAAQFLGSGSTELSALPAGLPIYVKGATDWSAVLNTVEPILQRQGTAVDTARAVFKDAGIDFDADLAGNLEPGFAFAVGVASGADVSNALQFDPRISNPFLNYTFVGIGRVKDATKAAGTMTKLGTVMAKYGATVTSKQLGGGTVYTASYQLGEGLSWTLRGNRLIAAGGYGDHLGAVLEDVSNGRKSLDLSQLPKAASSLLAGPGMVVYADLGRLNDQVSDLKTGSGLQAAGAEMAKSLITGWLHQVSALRPAVAIAPAGDGVNVDISVSLK